ncbi:MAG: 4Fe-4S dicluster domain-containing protein [Planctomycetes bacterium]|nr:4Fe-4S dicluster domain-containing protein [Planctomycetota bacterium]
MKLPVLRQDDCGGGGGGDGVPPAAGRGSRRSFLRSTVSVGAGFAALGAAISPLADLDTDKVFAGEDFFREHYKELSSENKAKLFADIEAQIDRQYGVKAIVGDPQPIPEVEFVYALNLSRCIGCRKCVHACVKENNQSRSPEIQYIRVLEIPIGTFDLERGNQYYDTETPKPGYFYMPIQCHQCANPPCTKVCPIEATWQEADGITVIDYDWCIGCRYCQAACPYWARRFNWTDPGIPSSEINPDMAYLSNRPRSRGVMEKCTFCLQRTRKGRMPACLEACPTGSRKFGNILDPNSEVSQILRDKRVFVLKEEVGTNPRFFYYFDELTHRLGEGGEA